MGYIKIVETMSRNAQMYKLMLELGENIWNSRRTTTCIQNVKISLYKKLNIKSIKETLYKNCQKNVQYSPFISAKILQIFLFLKLMRIYESSFIKCLPRFFRYLCPKNNKFKCIFQVIFGNLLSFLITFDLVSKLLALDEWIQACISK